MTSIPKNNTEEIKATTVSKATGFLLQCVCNNEDNSNSVLPEQNKNKRNNYFLNKLKVKIKTILKYFVTVNETHIYIFTLRANLNLTICPSIKRLYLKTLNHRCI